MSLRKTKKPGSMAPVVLNIEPRYMRPDTAALYTSSAPWFIEELIRNGEIRYTQAEKVA